MAKIVQSELETFYFHYPAVATIVTSHAGGRDNAMAVAWHTGVSREPPYYLVSIEPRRYTYDLVMESGEFTVNFVPLEKGELVAQVAGCSGRDVNKFEAFQIAAQPGSRVKPAVLDEAFAAYECRLVAEHSYGDCHLFVGEVLAVQWEASAFTSDGRLDLDRVSPISYMGHDYYATAAREFHLSREALVKAALDKAG